MSIPGEPAHCYRCGYSWFPRRRRVRICSNCKSPYFDLPKLRVPTYGSGLGVGELIGEKRPELLRLVRKYGGREVRVFGSVARRTATRSSDVDLLIDRVRPDSLRLTELRIALRGLLGRNVDVVPEDALYWRMAPQVLAEAVPL